jgi:alkylation response protein AidB-like acyl-CoA dehydrogenase
MKYANGRRQGGKIIIGHQSVAEELAELFVLLQAGRSLLWRAAWTATHREPDRALFRCARIFCAEAALKICIGSMETFGGYGVMRDMPIQKYVRDALTMQHGEGTTRIQKLSLAKIMESRFEESVPLVG